MIEGATLLSFIVASVALIITPGPNVAVILANGAVHGTRSALLVVAGTTLAQAAQIALVVLGLGVLLSVWGWAFAVVKWAGVAYLIWMAVKTWTAPMAAEAKPLDGQLFLRGAATALANPKTMIFHAAFLPLFVDQARSVTPQLFTLAVVFLLVALVLDSAYAVLGGGLSRYLRRAGFQRILNRMSGGLIFFAAGWLALRRSH